MKERILIVEDDPAMRLGMSHFLSTLGYDVVVCEDCEKAINILNREGFDLIITDLRLPDSDGFCIMREVKNRYPRTGVIIITAFADVKTAVQAIKDGAFDYLAKPFSNEELSVVIERFFKFHNLELEVKRLKESIKGKLIGVSSAIRDVLEKIEVIAKTDVPVLIHGESGTGKELVADAIHNQSLRKDGPYIKINCAAIPESLFESELFGYEKGAFTGAIEARKGRIELATKGTIFFDEIGDMPITLQAKLLRVIEDNTVTRLGGKKPIEVDVRYIYATSINLRELIKEGRFRDDLFYRINVIPITIPPLRDRKEDIPYLIEHFLRDFGERFSKPSLTITPPAYDAFLSYDYPGNVRELKHAIERAVLLSKDGIIDIRHLPEEFVPSRRIRHGYLPNISLQESIASIEKEIIINALNECSGKRIEAAKRLGISRKVLWRKIKEYGIE